MKFTSPILLNLVNGDNCARSKFRKSTLLSFFAINPKACRLLVMS